MGYEGRLPQGIVWITSLDMPWQPLGVYEHITGIKPSMQTNNNQAFHENHFYFKLALTFLINSVPLRKYFVYLICQSIYSIVPFYVEVVPIYHPDAHAWQLLESILLIGDLRPN